MLTVGPIKRRVLPTENSFEDAFADAIRPKSWHMSCLDKGWPDRYVTGGIWVELKVLDGWADQLYVEQKIKLTELAKAGNPTFYCALTQDHEVIFEPWLKVKGKFLKTFPRHKYRTKADLRRIFENALAAYEHCKRSGPADAECEVHLPVSGPGDEANETGDRLRRPNGLDCAGGSGAEVQGSGG